MTDSEIDEQKILSLTLDEWRVFKKKVFPGRPYVDRISIGFTIRMAEVNDAYGTHDYVIDEIDYLEGITPTSRTKHETQFKHKPLHPFWHKHFTTPLHIVPNIFAHWGMLQDAQRKRLHASQRGNKFNQMVAGVAKEHGDIPDIWPHILAHKFIMDAFEPRARNNKLTGSWIVFAKHEGRNYYLDIATHQENDHELYTKLTQRSAAEFPFLFD